MKYLRVNDHDMAYIEIGRGRPLVLVHGSLGDFRTWSSLLGPLSRRHRVIALSLRHFFPEQWDGIGGHYTIAQHISDLIAFIAELGSGPVDLMGHSRGGHIAFRVAQRRPNLLHRLILAEPGGELDASLAPPGAKGLTGSRGSRVAAAAATIAAGNVDEALREFIDGLDGGGTWAASSNKQQYRDNARTLLGQVNEQRQPFARDDVRSISMPTLLIGGEQTSGSFPVILRALAANIGDYRTVMIAGATHHMLKQDPVGTSAAILKLLAT
jgi:pimeloyl-ACP methyl ester carboxylesterase